MSLPSLDDNSLDNLYQWIHSTPLSREIRNIARDFSDGVMVAEIIAHFLPRYINLSNFNAVNSKALKRYNWEALNKLVFIHLDLNLNQNLIQKVISCQPGAIEFVLIRLKERMEKTKREGRFRPRRCRSRSAASHNGSNLSLNNLYEDFANIQIPTNCSNLCRGIANSSRQLHSNRSCGTSSIPVQKYHEQQQLIMMKDEQIEKLSARIRQLERLVALKDFKLGELTLQMDKLLRMKYTDEVCSKMLLTPNLPSEKGTNSSDSSSATRMTETEERVPNLNSEYSSFVDLK